MSRTSEQPKAETFNLRVDPTLKAAFTAATDADRKPAAEVLRAFMRAYVERGRRRAFEAEAGRQSAAVAERSRNPQSDDHASLAELDALFKADHFGANWTP